jgi:hypothetical protein
VPVRVGINIENDVAVISSVDDMRLLVAFLRRVAEDAARRLIDGSHVGIAPWSPKMVHGGEGYQKTASSYEPPAPSQARKKALGRFAMLREAVNLEVKLRRPD